MKANLKAGYEEYRRKCAESEGWKASGDKDCPFVSNAGEVLHKSDSFPTYDNDADIDRVVRLLDYKQMIKYIIQLNGTTMEMLVSSPYKPLVYLQLRATEPQKMEALYGVFGIEIKEGAGV